MRLTNGVTKRMLHTWPSLRSVGRRRIRGRLLLLIQKQFLDRLLEAVKVVIDDALLIEILFAQNADQRQKGVHLSQIQNGVVVQLNDACRIAVERIRFAGLFDAFDSASGKRVWRFDRISRSLARFQRVWRLGVHMTKREKNEI